MRLELLSMDVPKIQPFLETVLQDGGKKLYSIDGEVLSVHNLNGMSGFEYQEEGLTAQLLVGLILGGTGYVLKRTLQTENETLERHDYYNIKGEITFSSD